MNKYKVITLNVAFMMPRFTDVDDDGFLSYDFQQYFKNKHTYLKRKILEL